MLVGATENVKDVTGLRAGVSKHSQLFVLEASPGLFALGLKRKESSIKVTISIILIGLPQIR